MNYYRLMTVLGVIGLVAIAAILVAKISAVVEAARQRTCQNNLKYLGLALYNYQDTFGSFPPPITSDAAGRPMHSWRTMIAGFLESRPSSDPLHSYREEEPWNSPNNLRLADRMSNLFYCPTHDKRRFTDYAMVYGDPSPTRADSGVRVRDLRSSASTMVLAESHALDILWTEPRDLDAGSTAPTVSQRGRFISSDHADGANVVMADGSVRFIPFDTPPSVVGALIAGEPVKPSEGP